VPDLTDPDVLAAYLTEVKTYIGSGVSQWTDDEITQAMLAEAVDQSNRIRSFDPDAPFPESLVQALCRRVLRNLSLRAVPLGLTAGSGDGDGGGQPSYVPSRDPEVRRFEAPYRRLTVG
jgi:hypothetical protein